jgi:Spy/CpxP family protein refolding chaperone
MSISKRFANLVHGRTGLGLLLWLGTVGTLIAAVAFAHEGGGHQGHFSKEMSAEDMAEHVDGVMKHVYVEIDATDAQKAQLDPIVRQALTDLMPLHQGAHRFHEQAMALITADKVDQAALEAMRAEHVAKIDAASRRLTQLIVDVSEVLTPAQRKKLAEHVVARHHFGHG